MHVPYALCVLCVLCVSLAFDLLTQTYAENTNCDRPHCVIFSILVDVYIF
jgi:hypothetical protein